ALFKSGNVGRCRDREMFFQSCFLSDFIIDCLFLFRGLFFYSLKSYRFTIDLFSLIVKTLLAF
ncbi:hypothetical protein, partial [Helicobacter pylori]|uniref:hypothetical protein n=1 Tax=Helicobacter pylori TaxID=210 RepID=UPI001E2B6C3C